MALFPVGSAHAATADAASLTSATFSTQDNGTLSPQSHKVVVKLNKTKVYVGQKPSVKAVLVDGKKVSFSNFNFSGVIPSSVGKGSITAVGTGAYSGLSGTTKFKVVPHGTSLGAITPGVGSIKVAWGQQLNYTTGYQLQIATNSSFKSAKTFTIDKNTTTTVNVTGLKEKQLYYLRVRTYTSTSSGKIASPWSGMNSAVTKGTDVPKYQPTQKLKITKFYRAENYCSLSWTQAKSWYPYSVSASAKVSGYEVQWADNPRFNNHFSRTTFNQTDTGYVVTTLTRGETYYFRERLFNTVKAKTYYGPWSDVRSTASSSGGVG